MQFRLFFSDSQFTSHKSVFLFCFVFLVPPWNKKIKVIVTYFTIQTFFPMHLWVYILEFGLLFSKLHVFYNLQFWLFFFFRSVNLAILSFIYHSSKFISCYFSELQEKKSQLCYKIRKYKFHSCNCFFFHHGIKKRTKYFFIPWCNTN